ncbi:MAG: glycosyltransferase [Victivallaceae bacterium]
MSSDNIKLNISACLVVYNEEKLIERCLNSISGLCNEIIIIHDGECTDKTLEIARQYTNHIYIREHIGDAEPHRTEAYKYASKEWILIIDADEFLTEKAREIIRKELSGNTADYYLLRWPVWDGKKYRSSKWPLKPAIFRREKMRYIAFPHGEVTTDGKKKIIPARLEHQPQYDNYSLQTFREKHKKWIKIHARYLNRDIYSLPAFNAPEPREWPLHMRLIKKYGLFSIPVNFFVFLLAPFRRREALYTPWTVFRYSVTYYLYYVCLAFECRKIRKETEDHCKK